MSTPSSWRDLLKDIISDPAERVRIAKDIVVNPVTLDRWARGTSLMPRAQKLKQLVQAVPVQHRAVLIDLLQREYGNLPALDAAEETPEQIDYAFIQQVWETWETTPAHLLFWSVTGKVIENALRQLDSQLLGMAISVAQLMPPTADRQIHILRETEGRANPPWPSYMEFNKLFLGAESLAGYAVSRGRMEFIDDLRDQTIYLPAYRAKYEISSVACPIMYANRVAGCLICSSTQPGYFHPEWRRSLIQDYTRLLAPAFQPEHFFDLKQIELQLVPPSEVQHPLFVTFQQRVNTLMGESSHTLARPQAEQQIWQQIEEELLRFSYKQD